jgi:hypothetical protein
MLVTEEEYLTLDRAAEVRSEFLDGEMWAMSGGSAQHADLQSNIHGELYSALRGSECPAYTSIFGSRSRPAECTLMRT